jgi:hypothetical protein
MNQNNLYCPRCGNANQPDSQFCRSCGNPLQGEGAPLAQPPLETPQAYPYPEFGQPQPSPKKNDSLPWLILGVVVLLSVAVIAVIMLVVLPQQNARLTQEQTAVALQDQQQAATQAVISQKTLDAAVKQTLDAIPTPLPTVTPKFTTSSYDYSSLALTQNDFPAGFTLYDEQGAKSTGVDFQTMYSAITPYTTADPVYGILATTMSASSMEMSFGFVFAPLQSYEINSLDVSLNNPEMMRVGLASSLGGEVTLWDSTGTIGNASVGMDFTLPFGGMSFNGDCIYFRRGEAMVMVMSMWTTGSTHQVDTTHIAERLDQQLVEIQR